MDQNFINSTTRINRVARHKKKVIKRYSNRKLYDTEESSYVVLNDIAKMIRKEQNILIIDNETQEDITSATLTQIIVTAERDTSKPASLSTLKSIIKTGDGSFSGYLSKRRQFIKPQIQDAKMSIKSDSKKGSQEHSNKSEVMPPPEFQHKSLQERVVSAALATDPASNNEDTILPTSRGHIMGK